MKAKNIVNLPTHISKKEIELFAEREVSWLKSDEYIKRKAIATNKKVGKIKKEVDKIISHFPKTTIEFLRATSGACGAYSSDKRKPLIRIFKESESANNILDVLDHEIKHALSENSLTEDELLALFNGHYKKYPKQSLGKWYNFNPFSLGNWSNDPREQQVVAKRIMDYIEITQDVKRGKRLDISNIDTLKDDMVQFLEKEDWGYSDIIILMTAFKRKYGEDYPKKLLELINNAY